MEKAEATYMVWVDFRGTGMSTEEIETFIAQKAHIGTGHGFLVPDLAEKVTCGLTWPARASCWRKR